MINIGKINRLVVVSIDSGKVWLAAGQHPDIQLVNARSGLKAGDELDVLIYHDGKGTLLATTQKPKAQVDDVAWLRVVSVSRVGAFMDWGAPKDVFAPFSEQKPKMQEGECYLVKLYLDEDNRIVASARLDDFISDQAIYLQDGQAVELIIADETELGVKAIVNHRFWGILYNNELFQPVHKGMRLPGFIKKIRADNKIDLCLNANTNSGKASELENVILERLQKQNGVLDLGDKSPPQLIYNTFAVSKKVFKQAIGGLYKKRLITISAYCIRQVKTDE